MFPESIIRQKVGILLWKSATQQNPKPFLQPEPTLKFPGPNTELVGRGATILAFRDTELAALEFSYPAELALRNCEAQWRKRL